MRRRILGAALLIGLASAARAQGTDTPVQLRYHFQPGQAFHYRLTFNGDMGMSFGGILPPGAAAPGKMPITMAATYEFTQKVKAVSPEGAGTISASLDKMEMTSQMMGMNVVARLGAGGKMETLMNGQPMTLPNAPQVALTNPIYEGTVDPTGKISGVNPGSVQTLNKLFGGQNIASMFTGMPGMGGLVLPAQPVKPGDSWDQKFDLRMPIPMPGMAGGAPGGLPAGGTIAVNMLMHFKLLRVEAGSAVIETQISGSMPAGSKMAVPSPAGANVPPGMTMSFDKFVETVTGTQRFSVDQGTADGGDFDGKIAMIMGVGLPPGMAGMNAGAGPGAPEKTGSSKAGARKAGSAKPGATAPQPGAAPSGIKISMDGTLKMKVERLAAAEATAAPPAAP